MSDLKTVLDTLTFHDDAGVQQQLVDQLLKVKIRMARVRRKILVLSGKGGVGKSAVTTQLALALAREGKRVGIVDADLNGPCVPRMLGMGGADLTLTMEGAEPPAGPLGIRVASMAFLLQRGVPIRWKGPMDLTPVWLGMMEASVIREFLSDIAWGELDVLLVDLPPGAAADKPPTIANLVPELEGAMVVTTSSEVALEVVKKSIVYARDLGIRILGLVDNMSGTICRRCGHTVHPSGDQAERLAAELGLRLCARVPFDADLAQSLDSGIPLPEEHPVSRLFTDLARKL
ncbi:MAG: P-loop NTPase [Gemmatimonadetes bacterium]|nr:P-loop NTPase [Gemmatimonadota bacterium]